MWIQLLEDFIKNRQDKREVTRAMTYPYYLTICRIFFQIGIT